MPIHEQKGTPAGMPDQYLQAWFMPWAGLNKEIRIGPVRFWPFYNKGKNTIPDPSIESHLTRYFQSFVGYEGKPVDTITICSYKSLDFSKLQSGKVNDIRSAVDTLVFSAICPMTKSAVCADNRSISPPSADRYQLMGQNFIPGDDHITVQSGNTLHGGWKIGRITFPQPWHLGGNFGVPRDELIQGFDKAFAKDFPSPIRDRWFRSLEWFRLAHTETDEISIFSKIVMMATAFEILVQVPNIPNKKEWLAKELIKRCASSKSLKATRIDSKGKKYRYPKIAWWAWDFYNLRNKIVHGDSIPYKLLKYKVRNKKWLTHLIVADLIFWECLTRELYIQKCIGDHIKKEVLPNWQALFPKEPPEALENLLIPSMLGFNEIHRELGWLRQVSR